MSSPSLANHSFIPVGLLLTCLLGCSVNYISFVIGFQSWKLLLWQLFQFRCVLAGGWLIYHALLLRTHPHLLVGIYPLGCGCPEKVLCTQYPSTRHSTQVVFSHSEEIHVKELLLSNGRQGVRWKEGKARYMIGENSASSGEFVFFKSPAPTPLKTTFCPLCVCLSFFWALSLLVLWGDCSAVPLQLGLDGERAPFPAPVTCVWRV